MKKQTAVEWLIKELINYDKLLDGKRKNDDATVFKANPTKIYDQAKAMEKEQIMMAVKDSWYMAKGSNFQDPQEEQYYNETFDK